MSVCVCFCVTEYNGNMVMGGRWEYSDEAVCSPRSMPTAKFLRHFVRKRETISRSSKIHKLRDCDCELFAGKFDGNDVVYGCFCMCAGVSVRDFMWRTFDREQILEISRRSGCLLEICARIKYSNWCNNLIDIIPTMANRRPRLIEVFVI